MSSTLFDKSQGWSERFNEAPTELTKRYTASVQFDYRLAPYDIEGSCAHVQMLAQQKIIETHDAQLIIKGLEQIAQEISTNNFTWSISDEDVHLNIEKRLIALIGDSGKKLHTARSRNDQVATDIRLYLRHQIDIITKLITHFQQGLVETAAEHHGTVMPGFTHLQIAQPITFSHHLLAYVEMLARDKERCVELRKRVNTLPLGSAALAGTSYPIDRQFVADQLNFERICGNSLDAVSDRDFAIEFCSACAIIMMHLSRLSEELVLWMSPAYGFVELADRFCTGSSIMPQKKNPDIPELARGKTGRVYGSLMSLLTLMKGQPLAYNKDNQEDKEPLFDTARTVTESLQIFVDIFDPAALPIGIKVNIHRMAAMANQGFSTATDLADYLVKRGLTFRDAHGVVAGAVKFCEKNNYELTQLSLEQLRQFHSSIDEDVFAVLTTTGSVASRAHIGGVGDTKTAISVWRQRLQNN